MHGYYVMARGKGGFPDQSIAWVATLEEARKIVASRKSLGCSDTYIVKS